MSDEVMRICGASWEEGVGIESIGTETLFGETITLLAPDAF
jgi:hypothetical protein